MPHSSKSFLNTHAFGIMQRGTTQAAKSVATESFFVATFNFVAMAFSPRGPSHIVGTGKSNY